MILLIHLARAEYPHLAVSVLMALQPDSRLYRGGSARILPDRTRHSASHDTVARLRAHGAEILGEIAQFESIFLLCYLRGPAGIIVALAEQIG